MAHADGDVSRADAFADRGIKAGPAPFWQIDFRPGMGRAAADFRVLAFQIAADEAGREAEVAAPGDYLVYDIIDDSILIVRSGPDEIKAFYGVTDVCLQGLMRGD